MRVRSPLLDDLAVHTAAFVCISDNNTPAVIAVHYGEGTGDLRDHQYSPREPWWERFSFATLNYALWLHRPIRWDGWFLMVSESPAAHAARALVSRRIYTRDGTQVASVVQEVLFRPRR